jgi:hypothetical protein
MADHAYTTGVANLPLQQSHSEHSLEDSVFVNALRLRCLNVI